jgi:hypothetical protein
MLAEPSSPHSGGAAADAAAAALLEAVMCDWVTDLRSPGTVTGRPVPAATDAPSATSAPRGLAPERGAPAFLLPGTLRRMAENARRSKALAASPEHLSSSQALGAVLATTARLHTTQTAARAVPSLPVGSWKARSVTTMADVEARRASHKATQAREAVLRALLHVTATPRTLHTTHTSQMDSAAAELVVEALARGVARRASAAARREQQELASLHDALIVSKLEGKA